MFAALLICFGLAFITGALGLSSALGAFVGDYARRIAGNAPLTVQACKAIVDEIMMDPGERDLPRCQELVDRIMTGD